MTEDERREMLADLAAGTDALLQAVDGVADPDRKPSPERWSVRETVEHVALVEGYLLGRLLAAVDTAEPAGSPERESKIRRFAPTRIRRVSAPEFAFPNRRFATLNEALRAYQSKRDETTRYVETVTCDLRAKVADHPVLGKVNGFEMLLMMAAHPRRHAEQIVETRRAIAG